MIGVKEIKWIEFPEGTELKEAITYALYFSRDTDAIIKFMFAEKEHKVIYKENVDISTQCENYFDTFLLPAYNKTTFNSLLNKRVVISFKPGKSITIDGRLRKRNSFERTCGGSFFPEADHVIYTTYVNGVIPKTECWVDGRRFGVVGTSDIGSIPLHLCLFVKEMINDK